ncbi:hypothetical protein ACF1CY_002582 [Providencia rettgeri]
MPKRHTEPAWQVPDGRLFALPLISSFSPGLMNEGKLIANLRHVADHLNPYPLADVGADTVTDLLIRGGSVPFWCFTDSR